MPTLSRIVPMALLLVACKKQVPEAPPPEPFDPVPALPSPDVGSYARAPGMPKDIVVRSLVQGNIWDASLSGAMAGLALGAVNNQGGFTGREVRYAAWRAGYPYPIGRVSVWNSEPMAQVPQTVRDWLSTQPPTIDIGLVRARSVDRTVWVGAAVRPQIALDVLEKSPPLGASLSLPATPGASWAVSDPRGRLHHGALDTGARVTLDTSGEWLVEIRKNNKVIALFPIYVDVPLPIEPLLPTDTITVDTPAEITVQALDLLRMVRESLRYPPFERDPMLDIAAQSALTNASRSAADLALGIGLDPASAQLWRCESHTIEDCIDAVVYNPTYRKLLFNPDNSLIGLAAERMGTALRVVALVAKP